MIYAGTTYAFITVPIFVGLAGLAIRAFFKNRQMLNRLSSAKHRSAVLHNVSMVKLLLRTLCIVGALACLWLALLRPQYESQTKKPSYEQGRDLLIALDISRSMLAQDYQPNRLQFAKHKIKELLRYLSSERVGLIVFSGAALVQCPLTKDFDAFELFLDALDAEAMSHGTTDLASAFKAALTVFKQQPERKNKLLVIFTDGEDFSTNLHEIQKKAATLHVRVCTVGVGTPAGAPIPLYDEQGSLTGHIRDDAGKVVMSKLQEQQLKELAQGLDGLYLRATQDSTDVAHLCSWIAQFEKERFAATDYAAREETFMYFVAAGLSLLLVGRLL